MKIAGALALSLILWSTYGATAGAQSSMHRLSRNRTLALNSDQAWQTALRIAQDSAAIVNVLDSKAHLLSFTLPLSKKDVSRFLLDSTDLKNQPHMLHVTILLSPVESETRAYVRAVPSTAGFLGNSNGLVEHQLLDALEHETAWRTADDSQVTTRVVAQPLKTSWRAASSLLTSSEHVTVNESRQEVGLLTFSMFLRSSELSTYAVAKSYYPGIAHCTLWLTDSPSGTTVRLRLLLLEAGNLSAKSLKSTGAFEQTILSALAGSPRGQSPVLRMASLYTGKDDFWTVLFNRSPAPMIENSDPESIDELPANPTEVWAAALKIFTQTAIIQGCDSESLTLYAILSHAAESAEGFSVHEVTLHLMPSRFGTEMVIWRGESSDTDEEWRAERNAMLHRISTELFLKERLDWLLKGGG